jgi:hypothetical protein
MSRHAATSPRRFRLRHLGLLIIPVVLVVAVASAEFGTPRDAQAQVNAPSPTSPARPPTATGYAAGMVFGTLGSMADKAAMENAAGIRGATVELSWNDYEPAQGQFSDNYTREIIARVKTFQDAGQQLTLALGIHYTPPWVRGLPDAVPVDQNGAQRPGIDMVFSQPVRDAVAKYLARIDRDLGVENFTYVRLTSGGNAEVLYNTTGSYAAFSAAAQNGPNMARSLPRNPSPGWKPGRRTISTDEVRRWADWYVNALGNVTRWQMSQFDALGFKGVYQTITPGAGVRPDQYVKAVKEYLPDGLLGIGGAWHIYYAGLAGAGRIMVYVSSLADGSGNNNYCDSLDRKVDISSTTPNPWSATRWQSRLAVEHGFSLGGENPGFGDGIAVKPFYTDGSAIGMLPTALRQASRCDFRVFNFAHDDQIWKGPMNLAAYQAAITALG